MTNTCLYTLSHIFNLILSQLFSLFPQMLINSCISHGNQTHLQSMITLLSECQVIYYHTYFCCQCPRYVFAVPIEDYVTRLLYHFDQVFTECDVWCLWTLGDQVHRWNLTVTGTKIVHFWAKLGQIGPNYAKIDPMKCSQWPVTHDETPQVLNSELLVTCDWTLGQNGIVLASEIVGQRNVVIWAGALKCGLYRAFGVQTHEAITFKYLQYLYLQYYVSSIFYNTSVAVVITDVFRKKKKLN